MPEKLDRYWAQFLATFPDGCERPAHYCDSFYFGMTPTSARSIAVLVLNGIKTATGSLQWIHEAEHKPFPQAGDYNIVTDAEGQPICTIQDTEIRIIPYEEVDAAFASDGGEMDRSLGSWREIYWEYICSECARINRQPTLKTPLVCERFRVVYSEPLRDDV
jgi:uncharacterized protein YhfF